MQFDISGPTESFLFACPLTFLKITDMGVIPPSYRQGERARKPKYSDIREVWPGFSVMIRIIKTENFHAILLLSLGKSLRHK